MVGTITIPPKPRPKEEEIIDPYCSCNNHSFDCTCNGICLVKIKINFIANAKFLFIF